MVPVARSVGSNRIHRVPGIVHPVRHADLPPEEERELRRQLVRQALETLESDG